MPLELCFDGTFLEQNAVIYFNYFVDFCFIMDVALKYVASVHLFPTTARTPTPKQQQQLVIR